MICKTYFLIDLGFKWRKCKFLEFKQCCVLTVYNVYVITYYMIKYLVPRLIRKQELEIKEKRV